MQIICSKISFQPIATHLTSVLLHVRGWRTFFPPHFCVPVFDWSQVIYLFHLVFYQSASLSSSSSQSVVSFVLHCCSLCSLVIFLLSQLLNFCFAHSGWSSLSHISRNVAAHTIYTIANPPVSLPNCKFSQSVLVLVTLLWSSPAWKLPELVPLFAPA